MERSAATGGGVDGRRREETGVEGCAAPSRGVPVCGAVVGATDRTGEGARALGPGAAGTALARPGEGRGPAVADPS